MFSLTHSQLIESLSSLKRQCDVNSSWMFSFSYSRLESSLNTICNFQLGTVGYTLYGLLQGMPTHDNLHQVPFQDIAFRVILASEKSCKCYLDAQSGLLLQFIMLWKGSQLLHKRNERTASFQYEGSGRCTVTAPEQAQNFLCSLFFFQLLLHLNISSFFPLKNLVQCITCHWNFEFQK